MIIGSSGGIGAALCDLIDHDPRLGKLVKLCRRDDGFDLRNETTIEAAAQRLQGTQIHLLICDRVPDHPWPRTREVAAPNRSARDVGTVRGKCRGTRACR